MNIREFAGVATVDMTAPDAAERFAASFHDCGFAVLAEHGMPTELMGGIAAEWGACFDAGVPDEFWSHGGSWGYHRPDDGLMPDGTRRDRKDYFHHGLDRPLPPGVSDAAGRLFGRATEVARTLLDWLDRAAPDVWQAGRPTSSWVSTEKSAMRLQRYLPMDEPQPVGTIRALAHADLNLLTLLPAPEVAGLQLQTLAGEWVDLDHDPGLVIVNVGEMLQTATAGYYPATPHRVVVRDPSESLRERWSMPMFFHPADELLLAPDVTAAGFRAGRVEEYRRKGWLVSVAGGAAAT